MCDFVNVSWTNGTEDDFMVPELVGIGDCLNNSSTPASASVPNNRVSLTSFPEYNVSLIIYQTNLWIFWTLGLFGNTAALITVTKLKPFTPVLIYIGCLAASDIIYLTVKLIYEQMRGNLGYLGTFGCSPLLFLLHWTGKTSHWIILFMTVDRLIAVCFPFKVAQISTKKNVTLAMISLIVFQAGVNCHYFFSSRETTRGGSITCGTKPEYAAFRSNTLWLFFTLSSIIPCGGVLIMNVIMAFRLCRSMKKKEILTGGKNEKKVAHSNQSKKVTLMLMTVSLAFLFLVTPGPVFYLYVTYWNYRVSVQQTALYYFTRELVNACINADHAINFFLYFLSGTKFRNSFLSIIRCRNRKEGRFSGEQSRSKTKLTEAGGTSTADFNKI